MRLLIQYALHDSLQIKLNRQTRQSRMAHLIAVEMKPKSWNVLAAPVRITSACLRNHDKK